VIVAIIYDALKLLSASHATMKKIVKIYDSSKHHNHEFFVIFLKIRLTVLSL